MEAADPQGLLGLAIVVMASLAVVVFVFLRMAGLIGRGGHHPRPPPPPMA